MRGAAFSCLPPDSYKQGDLGARCLAGTGRVALWPPSCVGWKDLSVGIPAVGHMVVPMLGKPQRSRCSFLQRMYTSMQVSQMSTLSSAVHLKSAAVQTGT